MSFVAASVIGLGAAAVSAYGANSAAKTQADAQNAAGARQQQMFDTQRADLQPFRDAGATAAGKLDAASGGINTNDIQQFLNPGMDFAMKWGQQGVTNLNNASGGAFSGNTLKAISDYTTGSALNQYWNPAVQSAMTNKQNAYTNLYNTANLGATAAGAGATGAPAFAGQIGGNIAGAGASQAGGTVGAANAFSGGVNNGASWYSLGNIMNQNQNSPLVQEAAPGQFSTMNSQYG